VGIDVAKAELVVGLRPAGTTWSVPNHDHGITQLVERLQTVAPELVVLEATGQYGSAVTAALATVGIPVVVVNPRQVRDFAKALGKLAKTDALDALVLAHFADAIRPEVRPLPDASATELAALVARRRQVVVMLVAEKNRKAAAPPRVRAEILAHIAWLEERLSRLDDDLQQLISASPLWRAKDDLLRSAKGVGPTSPWCCWPNCPSSAASTDARSAPWSAWRRSTATAVNTMARALPGAVAARSAPPCTWLPWSLSVGIHRSKLSMTASSPTASRKWSPSSPACASS